MGLRGRIGAVLLVFGLTTLLTVGGALWVALRDLHRGAALGSLAELTVPYAAQARQRLPLDALRPGAGPGERPGAAFERLRDTIAGRQASDRFEAFVSDVQAEIAASGVSVLLVSGDSAVLRDPASGTVRVLDSAPGLAVPQVRGDVLTGTADLPGLGQVIYASTAVRDARPDRLVPALVLVRADDAAGLATADLLRALLVAAIVLLVIGVPIALGLSRSVTGPLKRLSTASTAVARGEVSEPLPTGGPREVSEASEAFNAMAAEVDATRQAQRQLLADVRHDLRTPLTVIAGFSEALRDGTAAGPAAERAAVAISDEAERLERMLDELDHLTIPGTTLPPLSVGPHDGRAIVRQTVGRFAPQAEAQGQHIDGVDDGRPAMLLADRGAVDRILGNIVVNALSHAPSPGGHARVEVVRITPTDPPVGGRGGWSGRPGVVLAVRDDGPGIPTAALPHVFDRFYRADPSRSSPGSGLGLAIVRDLAEALGGRAFAENATDGGARVGVVLPAAPPGAAPPRA